jgi:hypothetical protein
MPTVLRLGPYRFFFYAGDREEPEHVHVEAGEGIAKYWLDPVRLERSKGLSQRQLRDVERIVGEHQGVLLRAWHDYFQD